MKMIVNVINHSSDSFCYSQIVWFLLASQVQISHILVKTMHQITSLSHL